MAAKVRNAVMCQQRRQDAVYIANINWDGKSRKFCSRKWDKRHFAIIEAAKKGKTDPLLTKINLDKTRQS